MDRRIAREEMISIDVTAEQKNGLVEKETLYFCKKYETWHLEQNGQTTDISEDLAVRKLAASPKHMDGRGLEELPEGVRERVHRKIRALEI